MSFGHYVQSYLKGFTLQFKDARPTASAIFVQVSTVVAAAAAAVAAVAAAVLATAPTTAPIPADR
ncbi:hypothetical protein PG990_014702 [Apiospora arundinis]